MEMRYLLALLFMFCLSTIAFSTETVYMDQWCGQTKNINGQAAVRIRLTSSSSYNLNMNCTFTVYGDYRGEDRLMIDFNDLDTFDLNKDWKTPCPDDWLTLYDGDSSSSSTIGEDKYCGTYTPSTVYTTSGNDLTFYFHSDDSKYYTYTGFDIILTHFNTGSCNSLESECANGRCIDSNLVCNGYNPCGDYSDCKSGWNTTPMIIGIVLSVVAVVIIVNVIIRRRRLQTARQTVVAMTTVSRTIYVTGD